MFIAGIHGSIFQQGIFSTKYIYIYYFKIGKPIRFGKISANILQILFSLSPFQNLSYTSPTSVSQKSAAKICSLTECYWLMAIKHTAHQKNDGASYQRIVFVEFWGNWGVWAKLKWNGVWEAHSKVVLFVKRSIWGLGCKVDPGVQFTWKLWS